MDAFVFSMSSLVRFGRFSLTAVSSRCLLIAPSSSSIFFMRSWLSVFTHFQFLSRYRRSQFHKFLEFIPLLWQNIILSSFTRSEICIWISLTYILAIFNDLLTRWNQRKNESRRQIAITANLSCDFWHFHFRFWYERYSLEFVHILGITISPFGWIKYKKIWPKRLNSYQFHFIP